MIHTKLLVQRFNLGVYHKNGRMIQNNGGMTYNKQENLHK